MQVVVIGATGKVGSWVTTTLLSQGFNVRAVSRSLDRAEELFGVDGENLGAWWVGG
jgi:uncharacterized protein YbjT (DUF2867 family)